MKLTYSVFCSNGCCPTMRNNVKCLAELCNNNHLIQEVTKTSQEKCIILHIRVQDRTVKEADRKRASQVVVALKSKILPFRTVATYAQGFEPSVVFDAK